MKTWLSRSWRIKAKQRLVRNYHRNSEEYIQQSVIPTDHFQRSLPRLPIPKLENSCRRYLNALKPLLLPSQHERTSAIVNSFAKNDGLVLQKELVKKDKSLKHTSYISGPWFDMYLRDRVPLVLNYNPFLVFNDDPRQSYMNQTIRATNFIVSAMRFRRSLKENVLEPDIYHLNPHISDTKSFKKFVSYLPKSLSWYGAYWYQAYPLDMSQYGNLMNSTRIPKEGKDELCVDETSKHVLVIHRGQYYYFDVLDDNGNLVKADKILAHLRYICQSSAETPVELQVGVLTSQNRDIWAKARQKLINLGNEKQLHLVDSALFVVVLENEEPSDVSRIGKLFLFGKAENRWFDKSFSLIINKNGCSAVNFEHSWGDGVAVLRFINDVYRDTKDRPRVHPDTHPSCIDSSRIVKKIEWTINDDIENLIANAKTKYQDVTSNLNMSTLMYTQLNKNTLKEKNISPDSFMQLAFQMAYYRMMGTIPATYESCSTAAFKHGRTETVRSATNETKSACQAFENKNVGPQKLYELMRNCTEVHNQLTKEAALGQGFDRHLMALKKLAEERGMHPAIYEDPSYKVINNILLSTSSLSSPAISFGGFGPVSPEGFGIGYTANNDFLGCNITSYGSATDASNFKESLHFCFEKLHDTLKNVK